ncbi:MAG: hypothetical protein ACLQK4_13085 [Acidimicrobiales bacterium]|jgi:hypothetical protein
MAPRPTRSNARLWRTVIPITIVALGLGACGSTPPATARGRQSAPSLASQTVTALGKVPYVEVSGSIGAGAASKSSSITVTDVVEGGAASMGTVDVVGNPMGTKGERFWGSVQFVVSNQITWVKGSTVFWSSLLSTAGADKAQISSLLPKLTKGWIELISASTSVFNTETAGLIDPRGFAQEFLHDSVSRFSNKGDVYLNGRHVVELETNTGATVDLAPSGSSLPAEIRTQSPSPITTGLHYSYPASATIEPPKHFQYLETVLKPYLKTS